MSEGVMMRARLILAMEAVAGISIWLLVVVFATSAIERKLIGTSNFSVPDDIIGYMMAMLLLLGFPVALHHRAHVKVDLAFRFLSTSLQRKADRLFRVIAFLVSLGIAFCGAVLAYDSYSIDRISYGVIDVPLWIPQAGIMISGLLLALGFLAGDDDLAASQDAELT
jgi:TRAP-type mannitol/chloroaromatic compound transport system permease small subunit